MLGGAGKHGTPSRWRSPQAERPHRKQGGRVGRPQRDGRSRRVPGGWWVDGENESGYALAADLEDIDTDPLPTHWRPLPDNCAPVYWRVAQAIRDTGLTIFARPLRPGRQGTATSRSPNSRSPTPPGNRHFKAVTLLRTYPTPFRAPQPLLFPLDDAQWLKARRVLVYAPRRTRREVASTQLPLCPPEVLDALPTSALLSQLADTIHVKSLERIVVHTTIKPSNMLSFAPRQAMAEHIDAIYSDRLE